jgi:hypothetical protein
MAKENLTVRDVCSLVAEGDMDPTKGLQRAENIRKREAAEAKANEAADSDKEDDDDEDEEGDDSEDDDDEEDDAAKSEAEKDLAGSPNKDFVDDDEFEANDDGNFKRTRKDAGKRRSSST